ncbi:hypothetical protein [Halegenticoccus tardaugens]|uniref:hypothetical protein n=1 Tax=Halegenticoccus tardaugens TaxID=2071624 RepID=UPI00100BA554|nr:hypothetical protein [Halegenticoccus tardaugens]
MESGDGKEPWPNNIDETTQGHPDEPHIDDNLIIDFASDDTRSRAREALKEADQHDEIEYLSALITVIDYHRDPTFDTDLF